MEVNRCFNKVGLHFYAGVSLVRHMQFMGMFQCVIVGECREAMLMELLS